MPAQNLWRWENPGNGRYYEVAITQDMFGQWAVIKLQGGLLGQYAEPSQWIGSTRRVREKSPQDEVKGKQAHESTVGSSAFVVAMFP